MRRLRDYLGVPIVLTRGGMYVGVALLGFIVVVLVVGAWQFTHGLADERSRRSATERAGIRREIEAERKARRRGDRVNARLARLERPTDRELIARITRVLALLRRHPELAGRLVHELAGILAADGTRPSGPRPHVSRGDRSSGQGRVPARRSPGTRPDRPLGTRPDGQAGGTPPPRPRPPVDVPAPTLTTPLGTLTTPTVCIPPVGGVGCP